MTPSPFRCVLWKEYRVQRAFWLCVAGFAVALQFFIAWVVRPQDGLALTGGLFGVAQALAACYAVGCGAVLFAAEREEGTRDLLRGLPASSGPLLAGKAAFALASTLALLVVLNGIAWALAPPPGRLPEDAMVPAFVVMVGLEFLVWGALFSLLMRKVLHAVWMTVVAVFAVFIAANFFEERAFGPPAATVHGVSLVLAAAAAVWLTRRWMLDRPLRWSPDWSADQAAWRLAGGARERARPWQREFRRLLWKEVRHARGPALWWLVSGVGLVVSAHAATADAFAPAQLVTFLVLPLVPLLIGVWTFRGEQENGGFRFLADRGLSPGAVWLSKHLVWIPVLLVMTTALLAADAWGAGFRADLRGASGRPESVWGTVQEITALTARRHGYRPASAPVLIALAAGLIYASGQLASLFLARAIVAGFVGAVLAWLLIAWMVLMGALEVPLFWSVASIPAILLLATLVRTSDWLVGRNTWRAWLKVGAVLAVPGAAVLGGVIVWRIVEIPKVPVAAVPPAGVRPSPGPESLRTGSMYREARARIPFWLEELDDRETLAAIRDGWEHADPQVRDWLAETDGAVQAALAAAQRPEAAFADPRSQAWGEWAAADYELVRRLAVLLLVSARQLEADGQLDAALERYLAVLRLARHTAHWGGPPQWGVAWLLLSLTSEWMPLWAAHSDQDAQRVRDAVRRTRDVLANFPLGGEPLHFVHEGGRRLLEADRGALSEAADVDDTEIAFMVDLVDRLFPWERIRARRHFDAIAAAQRRRLSHVGGIFRSLDQSLALEPGVLQWDDDRERDPPWKWKRTTPLASVYQGFSEWDDDLVNTLASMEARGRLLLVSLALAGWRHDRGALPARLDALVPAWFDRLPVDPWTGHEFGYRPEGFPVPVAFSNRTVEAGRPVLWSAGPYDGQVVPVDDPAGPPAQYRITPSARFLDTPGRPPDLLQMFAQEIP